MLDPREGSSQQMEQDKSWEKEPPRKAFWNTA